MSAKPATATVAAITVTCAVALSSCTADETTSATRATAQAAAASPPGPGQPTTNDGKLIAVYEPGTTPSGEKTRSFLEKNHVLDDIATQANTRVTLAYDVPLWA